MNFFQTDYEALLESNVISMIIIIVIAALEILMSVPSIRYSCRMDEDIWFDVEEEATTPMMTTINKMAQIAKEPRLDNGNNSMMLYDRFCDDKIIFRTKRRHHPNTVVF